MGYPNPGHHFSDFLEKELDNTRKCEDEQYCVIITAVRHECYLECDEPGKLVYKDLFTLRIESKAYCLDYANRVNSILSRLRASFTEPYPPAGSILTYVFKSVKLFDDYDATTVITINVVPLRSKDDFVREFERAK